MEEDAATKILLKSIADGQKTLSTKVDELTKTTFEGFGKIGATTARLDTDLENHKEENHRRFKAHEKDIEVLHERVSNVKESKSKSKKALITIGPTALAGAILIVLKKMGFI